MSKTNYLYVVALTDSRNAAEMHHPGDMLGFKHAFVQAHDDVEAYVQGFNTVELASTETRMNDYVVKL